MASADVSRDSPCAVPPVPPRVRYTRPALTCTSPVHGPGPGLQGGDLPAVHGQHRRLQLHPTHHLTSPAAVRSTAPTADTTSTGMSPQPGLQVLEQLQIESTGRRRRQNEYVHAPASKVNVAKMRTNNNGAPTLYNEFSGKKRPEAKTLLKQNGAQTVITQQPKLLQPRDRAHSIASTESEESGITCSKCGKCKCLECAKDTPLPHWSICDDKCLCSADNLLDYLSCVCCVKGVFYHCSKDIENSVTKTCVDNPCSCSPHSDSRCWRFGTMGIMSLCLPCLWCYWPFKGCIKAVSHCYSWHHSNACQCEQNRLKEQPRRPATLERRSQLLALERGRVVDNR